MAKKQLAKTESKAVVPQPMLANTASNPMAWGAPAQALTSRDFTIPKILAMQAMSNAVTNGTAKFGEFRDSLSGVVLGDEKHPIEFIPFYMEKVYVVMKEKEKKFRFHHQELITPETEEHEYEVDAKDGPERWYRTTNFYVLLPSEIKNGGAIPYILSFRSSSARAGLDLNTIMYMKNMKAGKTPASLVIELFGAKTQNDKGTFIVMGVKEKRVSSEQELEQAFEWFNLVKKGKVKVDHSDLESDIVATAPPSGDY